LDFWTYGCINCLHMILVIEQPEEKYAEELVVVGVHSAKFTNEGQTENIREIVQRYEMKHPVINDFYFEEWGKYDSYRVNASPTFVLIDPRGNLFAVQPGEIPFQAFDDVIGTMVRCFDATDDIDRTPIAAINPELASAPPRALNFPGKVLADADGGRLFIADSVNHRLVIADINSYEVLATIGNGARGFTDGDYATAQFYKPQGMALSTDGTTLYVADTFNHTVRAVDLTAETVATVAGTGIQGTRRPSGTAFPALATNLRSPWALAFGDDDNTMYVAMAGTHQIWTLDLAAQSMRYVVGNGFEAQISTTLLDSELAQPSGLYFTDGDLYFADSESSTIRVADIDTDTVEVVSGTTENSLFTYGDVDGAPGESLLQHALGVTGDGEGIIFIADTYNNKIKQITTDGFETITLTGGSAGFRDGTLAEARFHEPGGLSYADGRLFIADTN
ncbi:MAG: thioredoxin-like domain-containing protein, partial [Chloroflexota bacterium]